MKPLFINVHIKGTTPLLMNKFTDAAMLKATSGAGTSTVGGRDTPREDAESRLYTDSEGNIVMPQPNLLRNIIDAGKYFKAGKSKVTTQKSSLIPACVSIAGVDLPLSHDEPWNVDSRPVVIPATGGRIVRHRPRFDDWNIKFELQLDQEIIAVSMLRDIVDAGGQRIGLGDFRPDRKGPFGKYNVILWDVQKS